MMTVFLLGELLNVKAGLKLIVGLIKKKKHKSIHTANKYKKREMSVLFIHHHFIKNYMIFLSSVEHKTIHVYTYIKCLAKVFIPLNFFHVLLCCCLMLNCFKLLFYTLIYTT